MIKRRMPKARVIEAVGTAKFKDEIDVLVPVTSCYENHREAFDQYAGKEVWNYVCCGPEGKWLNRFLDFALIKGRILIFGDLQNTKFLDFCIGDLINFQNNGSFQGNQLL